MEGGGGSLTQKWQNHAGFWIIHLGDPALLQYWQAPTEISVTHPFASYDTELNVVCCSGAKQSAS